MYSVLFLIATNVALSSSDCYITGSQLCCDCDGVWSCMAQQLSPNHGFARDQLCLKPTAVPSVEPTVMEAKPDFMTQLNTALTLLLGILALVVILACLWIFRHVLVRRFDDPNVLGRNRQVGPMICNVNVSVESFHSCLSHISDAAPQQPDIEPIV